MYFVFPFFIRLYSSSEEGLFSTGFPSEFLRRGVEGGIFLKYSSSPVNRLHFYFRLRVNCSSLSFQFMVYSKTKNITNVGERELFISRKNQGLNSVLQTTRESLRTRGSPSNGNPSVVCRLEKNVSSRKECLDRFTLL